MGKRERKRRRDRKGNRGKYFSHKELKYKDVVDFILENRPS